MSLKDQIMELIASKGTGSDIDTLEEVGKIAGIAECAELLVAYGFLTAQKYNEIEDAASSLMETIEFGTN